MNLKTECPKCGQDKLSHQSQNGKVLSVRCRECKWAKELKGKDHKKLKDEDYE